MRDVAKRAGVSLSTVSLVVNGAGYVSDQMHDRVEAAMHDLNYIPNELARNLYRDRTNIVGIIVPTIRHPFFSTLTAVVQHELAQHGLRTLLCSTVDADTGEAQYVDMLRRHMMDGIVMAAHTSHAPDFWTSIGRPVVAFDRYLGEGIPSVGSDHEEGGRLVARHLIRSGARHVVAIGGPRNQFHDLAHGSAVRSSAVVEGHGGTGDSTTFPTVRYHMTLEHELRTHGVGFDYVEAGEVYDLAGYAHAVEGVFDRFPDVDAMVSSDLGAAYCVQEALRRGIVIPRRLQIIAYDGTFLADAAGMKLTAVRQDFVVLASHVARRMIRAIEDNAPGARPSSGAPASDSASAVGSGDESEPLADLVPMKMAYGETTR
jgi:LacI family sucrose operon transcriptional repressor